MNGDIQMCNQNIRIKFLRIKWITIMDVSVVYTDKERELVGTKSETMKKIDDIDMHTTDYSRYRSSMVNDELCISLHVVTRNCFTVLLPVSIYVCVE